MKQYKICLLNLLFVGAKLYAGQPPETQELIEDSFVPLIPAIKIELNQEALQEVQLLSPRRRPLLAKEKKDVVSLELSDSSGSGNLEVSKEELPRKWSDVYKLEQEQQK